MDKTIQISGKKLAGLRRARFVTQEEVARALGLSKGRMTAIEGEDRTGMYLKNFRKLADFLKIAPTDLEQKLAPKGSPSELVTIELPRAIYDSIAARAAHEGYPDVPAFLADNATTLPLIDVKRDPPGRVSSPAPAGGGRVETPEPSKPRRRQRQRARTA